MLTLPLIPGVRVAIRPVLAGDEGALAVDEAASLAGMALVVRRRSASSRLAARELLAEAGWPGFTLPRRHGSGPDWPPGLVGSLTHTDLFAGAALAARADWASVGIDIEPAEPLDSDVLTIIATAKEAATIGGSDMCGRVLFCAKEAAYKAMFTLDQRFLEPQQVIVELGAKRATACYGREVGLTVHVDCRIVLVVATARTA